jgi:signal transduction histidine kinase/CheY-like chemotaxis protein
MAARQRIVRVRREYNQWVANQTLEDYALRFTAKAARRWSAARVANTALGAISFLALEAIGGTITVGYGFANAVPAILAVSALIFAAGLPVAAAAARSGVDIDLLTRGAGFGYIGSTITSLIYASFTFIFFAIEAVILAAVLQACLGVPPWLGYVICAAAVIPLVTHGITFISRFQLWTQPAWLVLHALPFAAIAWWAPDSVPAWLAFRGGAPGGFALLPFGAAASVVFALVTQLGEQADFLRFLPPPRSRGDPRWWTALLLAGPGWIVPGALKLLAGSFLATLAVRAGLSAHDAAQPVGMYRVAFAYVTASPGVALVLTALFVTVSQLKINITNAYAGSIAWSNFFSRLTHSHPGRVVWLVFNIAIALLLMELGIYEAIERTLVAYSALAAAWMGALVADLVVNKPLGFSPAGIEFKRAHLHDINPVGVGAMLLGIALSLAAGAGLLGAAAQAFAPFLAFGAAFATAPVIAWATGGRFYLARKPRAHWARLPSLACIVCENAFEPEDMAHCPAYAGPICSLCCSLDARCHDGCKPASARAPDQAAAALSWLLPGPLRTAFGGALGRAALIFALMASSVGAILLAVYAQAAGAAPGPSPQRALLAHALWQAFWVLLVIAGVAAWLLSLAVESRRVAQEEMRRQTGLLTGEVHAHRRTDAQLQRAKEAAEAANLAKSRFVVGVSHELRTPLNAILGYAQLLERDPAIPEHRRGGVRIIRRSGEHLAGLIEGLLDISKIEAGRIDISRDRVRFPEFLEQLAGMFRLQADAKGIAFAFEPDARLPGIVHTDEGRLRQILINLLSNAVKFTRRGGVTFRVRWRSQMAEFEIEDTGPGIAEADQERVFEPFQRARSAEAAAIPGIGLGLTITRLLTRIMGGELVLTSDPGSGSLFRVKLLLVEGAPRPAEPAATQEVAGYEGRRRTVLVADDDAVHRDLMREALTPLGFAVLLAQDGPACLALAAAHRPDLFLVDLSMPGMSGWELARRLRADGQVGAILLVSANAGELRTEPGRCEAGAAEDALHDGTLAKPVMLPALLDAVRRLLGLTWTEGLLSGAPPGREPAHAAQLGDTAVAELRHLGAIGYVRGIQTRLDELAREQPGASRFLDRLRGHVAEFRLDAFLSALETPGSAEAAPCQERDDAA